MRHIRKNKPNTETPIVLYDDREGFPWKFLSPRFELRRARLKVGDYTFAGFEDKVVIEKKSGLGELFCNLTAKERPRFKRFLYRLSKFPVKVIIVEDDLSNIPYALSIVKKKSNGRCQLTIETIHYFLAIMIIKYGIPVLFTGTNRNCQRATVLRIFEEAWVKCQE